MVPEINEFDENEIGPQAKKRRLIKYIVYSSIDLVVGTLIALILSWSFKSYRYMEAAYFVWGTLNYLFIVVRRRVRDGKLIKENHSIVEDKESLEYIYFKRSQWAVFILGSVFMLLSLICFFCVSFGQTFTY